MILQPQSRQELLTQLAANFSRGAKIAAVDVRELNKIVEYSPEDMTASVEAGMTLRAFQQSLRVSGQWLPIDPPDAERLTIGDLLAFDHSGSRRLGYGTIRDYLIGIKVALADGTLIKAGGKVVKNVAGYDLCKLFVGARHTLGIIVEGTFKLRPLPEKESFARMKMASFAELARLRSALLNSPAEPISFDAYGKNGRTELIAAFAGIREDVDVQVATARALGFEESTPSMETNEFLKSKELRKLSVLPSETVRTLERLNRDEWLAHLGNGVVYYRGEALAPLDTTTKKLMDRVKSAYDPNGIFPSYAA